MIISGSPAPKLPQVRRIKVNSFLSQSDVVRVLSLLHLILLCDTHTRTVGFLWTEDRPVAETSTWQHTHKKQTSMLLLGFEPVIQASGLPLTHALVDAATGVGLKMTNRFKTRVS